MSEPIVTPSQSKVDASVGKTKEPVKKVLVKSSDAPTSLIEWDAKGVELLFDGREDFITLTEGEVRQLSAENKRRYSMAAQQHEVWMSSKADSMIEEFSSAQYTGRATDKLKKFVGDPNFQYYWSSRDKVPERLAKGWTIVQADEARTYLGPTNNHHEISAKGVTELVMMKLPKALYKKRLDERTQKNRQRAMSAADQFDSQARSSGVKPIEDDPNDGRDWREQPSE